MKTVLQTTRPPFLLLTPLCLFLAVSYASYLHIPLDLLLIILIFIGALSAHICVNTLNEYQDFTSGLDLNTIRTPFSGGSGTLPNAPELARKTFALSITSLLVTVGVGCYFIWQYSVTILPFGLIGIAIMISYTRWINKKPWLCLIAPGVGFGMLMIVGTYFLISGEISPQILLLSLIPFFHINNLLLLNQYPDIQADQGIGRRTFPIIYGVKVSNWVYIAQALLAYVFLFLLILEQVLPTVSFAVLFTFPLNVFAWFGAIKHGKNIGEHPQYLAVNVAVALLTPLILIITLVYR